MNNGIIQQALLTASYTVDRQARDTPLEFVLLSNPHTEKDAAGKENIKIVDCHCENISFGLPLAVMGKIMSERLSEKIGSFLNIIGRTADGNQKTYSFEINEEFIDMVAYSVFTILSMENGKEYLRANIFKWRNWMRTTKWFHCKK